jgi:hypothetical protein
MANNVTLDADVIAARFYITNVAISDVKGGVETLNQLSNDQYQPSQSEIDIAIQAMGNPSTVVAGVPTCSPCTINNKAYYGLTPSQCSAMGGR